jgi:hypothetical protein
MLRNAYRPLDKSVSSSATVVDRSGKILAWLLPDLLSEPLRVCSISHINSTSDFGHPLKHSAYMMTRILWPALRYNEPKNATSWRTMAKYYKARDACQLHPRGSLNLSPGWHEQGNDVGPVTCIA